MHCVGSHRTRPQTQTPADPRQAANGTNGASDAPSVPLWEVVGGATPDVGTWFEPGCLEGQQLVFES